MSTDTDSRLRSWLDSNQREREQMCRSLLALDPHYSDVRPRHPSGGPDGGRDIEGLFDGSRIVYGAVGFQNGANDSAEQKRKVKAKFASDLKSALNAKPDLKVFAFLTNVRLTTGEQSRLIATARKTGIEHCDVIDRERLRIELDSPAGYFLRFQHLHIPLSEAEQASFLARYGDRIQEVVATGFQRIERTLNRVLFLQESADVLFGVYVRFQLKESYSASDIGHFRAFVSLSLRAIKHNIVSVLFGSADKSNRFSREDSASADEESGIAHGIGKGQWEWHFESDSNEVGNEIEIEIDSDQDDEDASPKRDLVPTGSASGAGMDSVQAIVIEYRHDDILLRYRPRLELRDLDDCMFIPILNRSLAEKLHSFEVFANGYKLAQIGHDGFKIGSQYLGSLPDKFTHEELADPWVSVRPSNGNSCFQLHFSSTTPRRMFAHEEIPDVRSKALVQTHRAESDTID